MYGIPGTEGYASAHHKLRFVLPILPLCAAPRSFTAPVNNFGLEDGASEASTASTNTWEADVPSHIEETEEREPASKEDPCQAPRTAARSLTLPSRVQTKDDFEELDDSRYKFIRTLRAGTAKWPCQIELQRDLALGRNVVVKRFPDSFIAHDRESFMAANVGKHDPWQELLISEAMSVGSTSHCLTVAELSKVVHDTKSGDVLIVCPMVPEGDLFDIGESLGPPGPAREAKTLPIFKALLRCVFSLHDMGICHGNVKVETAWLHTTEKSGVQGMEVWLSDFCDYHRAPENQKEDQCSMYTAPEVVQDDRSADLFACGVVGYTLAVGRFPWLSTRPGSCRAFDFAQQHGIDEFLRHSKCPAARNGWMSDEYKKLLIPLLEMDPTERLLASTKLRNIAHLG
eukprot:TRINITY_DN5355_c2_g1_i1.p1 TRINITY_DN5355_c2_g1~~TRINITY_DN5355_c2_g1_i1.p1  ORF type:complete len:400 (-),score=51.07 TRINITY_DN5355_c2_g1_i1:119-1318(-)